MYMYECMYTVVCVYRYMLIQLSTCTMVLQRVSVKRVILPANSHPLVNFVIHLIVNHKPSAAYGILATETLHVH